MRCRLENMLDKFVPRYGFAAGVVVNAANGIGVLQQADDGGGQVAGIGRAADLVVDGGQRGTFPRKVQHGADKVVPVFAKQPRSPQDKAVGIGRQCEQFAGGFGLSVYIGRVGKVAFLVGSFPFSVKDIVG
ncbi:Uncharacterised protein [Neisseria meningitidis]|nr:Uncharacterised protein [Neisseria meningitidis]